jgi:flavin reductase (DIM6/NTAB) family NADH-FMN oxidoreductase RutF
MKQLLRLLRDGRGLRHLPVVYPGRDELSIRLVLRGLRGGDIDVTKEHVPVSLKPLVLGVRLDSAQSADLAISGPLSVAIYDTKQRERLLAVVRLKRAGELPLSRGTLCLFETTRCRNWCAPVITRWVRYALAWQHARGAARRRDGLSMSAADLVCLNAYYIDPRPVYLVGVSHDGQSNLFPMDLVGPVSSGDFLLALRATSPATQLMEASRRVAMSAAPSDSLDEVYALGAHHRSLNVNLDALPIATAPSPMFGLPALAAPSLVRELAIGRVHRVGSHVLFVCRIENETGTAGKQLAHVSAMYAEWLIRHGRAMTSVAGVV